MSTSLRLPYFINGLFALVPLFWAMINHTARAQEDDVVLLSAGKRPPIQICFDPSERRLLALQSSTELVLFDLTSKKLLNRFEVPVDANIHRVQFGADGSDVLAVGISRGLSDNGRLAWFRASPQCKKLELISSSGVTWGIASISRAADLVVVADCSDRTKCTRIITHDFHGRVKATFPITEGFRLIRSPESTLFLEARESTVNIRQASDGSTKSVMLRNAPEILDCRALRQGKVLASIHKGNRGEFYLWDSEGKSLKSFHVGPLALTSIDEVSGNGNFLAIASGRTIHIVSAATCRTWIGSEIPKGIRGDVQCVALSQSGQYIAIGLSDGKILVKASVEPKSD